MKVVFCGPPHSGKSCLRYALKEAIKAIPGAPYPYVITACPDGEGSWFQETSIWDPELANALRAAYKAGFTDEWTNLVRAWVERCPIPLTLVDTGGRIDAKNESICGHATHAILLAGDLSCLAEWREFCHRLKLQIIAEIHSDYQGKSDNRLVLCEDGAYRGSVHHLERGDASLPRRPTVAELAKILVGMVAAEVGGDSVAAYNITLEQDNLLRIGFGARADNDQIVKETAERIGEMIQSGQIVGGEVIRINGPASMPVAMVLAHGFSHLYQAVACYDPKLAKYVVVIAHGDKYRVGNLIE